jgi:hypothetical protein
MSLSSASTRCKALGALSASRSVKPAGEFRRGLSVRPGTGEERRRLGDFCLASGILDSIVVVDGGV